MLKEYPELLDNEASIGEWKDKKEKARANIDDIIKELHSNAADTLADEKRNMEKFGNLQNDTESLRKLWEKQESF